MKKILSFILFAAFFSMNTMGVYALSLPVNTPVLVKSEGVYDSGSLQAGSEIDFSVVSDVSSDMGKVVIKAGTPVTAKVVSVRKSGRIGKPGKIAVGGFSTKAINGANVPLSGSVAIQGKSKMGLSIALSLIVIPFFLLMKGKDTQIMPGAQYTLYTAAE